MLLGDVLLRPFAAWLLQCSVATLQAKGHIAGAWVQPPARQRLASRLLIPAGPLLGPHRRTDLKIDRIRGTLTPVYVSAGLQPHESV